jgi:hypothetical protein
LQGAGFADLPASLVMLDSASFLVSLLRWLNSLNPGLARLTLRFLQLPGISLPFEPWFTLMNILKRGLVISVFARVLAGPVPARD